MSVPSSTTKQRWRPEPFNVPGEIDKEMLELAIKTAYDNTYGLEQTSAQMPTSLRGSSIANGIAKVTGLLKGIATGLSTVSNVIVSLDNGATPTNLTVTARPSPNAKGKIDIFVWQPTSASVTTPVAATVQAIVRWHAWGTI